MSTLPELETYNTGKRLYLGVICINYAKELEQETDRIYPCAPLENNNDDIERRIEKRLSDVNSFNKHFSNVKELITYIRDKNHKSKKK